jgi:hypothetical protein
VNYLMKRRIVTLNAVAVAASLFLAAPIVSAVEAGLGAGIVGDGGGTIYVPIRFGNLRIEPELSFYRSTNDTTATIPTNTYEYEAKSISLGSGVYLRQPIGSSLETYVGGRVGYYKSDSSRTYPNSPGSNYSSDASGFYVGPTIGAEYFFNKQFSIGLDVSVLYRSGTNDSTSGTTTNNYNSDTTDLQTETRTALRFYY